MQSTHEGETKISWRDIPFSKGFVFTQKVYDKVAHFTERSLPSGWHLWTDDATEMEIATSSSGDFAVLRGHWIDTSDGSNTHSTAESLLSDFQRGGELQLHRRLAMLGGRFFLALHVDEKTWIYNDATGLRSVYYSRTAPLVASHLHIITQLQSHSEFYSPDATLHALDATPYPEIRQLLPNFRLDPKRTAVERFFPFEPNRFTSMNEQARLDRVIELWDRVMNYYYGRSDKIALSITGGLDSKLMLAMCGHDANQLDAYTYGMKKAETKYSESLNFDFRQVKDMLPHLDLKSHQFIDITNRTHPPEALASVLDANTWGNHGRHLIPRYREIFPGDGWYHLRGTGVEIIRRYWPNNPHKKRGLDGLLGPLKAKGGEYSPALKQRAVALGYDQPQHGYDLTDLIYWEVRMGKWHSEILNEQDAVFETFLPISVREIYELLLAYPEKDRVDAIAVTDLINRKNPVLNFWGANSELNLYERRRAEKATLEGDIDTLPELPLTKAEKHITTEGTTLHLPKDQFYAGHSVSTEVFTASREGLLTFVVEQPFRNLRAQGYFEWQVTLNGKCYLKCDGAVSNTPTTVTIWNLPKEVTVALVIRAHRDSPRETWERASRIAARLVKFMPGKVEGDGETRIASDNPLANVTAASDGQAV